MKQSSFVYCLNCYDDLFLACSRYPGPTFVEPYMENITAIKGTDVLFTCRVANLGRNMVSTALAVAAVGWGRIDEP